MIGAIQILLYETNSEGGRKHKMKETGSKIPDTIYVNGNVYTVNKHFERASAFAVKGDRFIAVGSDKRIRNMAGSQTEVVDLEGKTVLPGMIESHIHMESMGMGLLEIDAHDLTLDEILAEVKQKYEDSGPDAWIRGDGWHESNWNASGFPTKEDLDRVSPDKPVCIRRACGHASWANSRALELAHITRDTPNPVGGEILRDENGEATGMVTDAAQQFLFDVWPEYTYEECKKADLLAQEVFFRNGITTVHDAGSTPAMIKRWEDSYEAGELKVRICGMFRAPGRPTYEQLLAQAGEYFKTGLKIGKFDNRLTVRAFKISSDGSLGARSAWMIDDYSDRPGHKGNGKFTDEELYELVHLAADHGFQVVIHAIGDACNKQALDVFEAVFSERPPYDHRFRIEHSQILRLEDIPRFAKLHVIPSMQPIAIGVDKTVAVSRVGEERIKGAYAWRALIDAGSDVLPISSDAPIDPIYPLLNMCVAVTRKDRSGEPEGGWYKEMAMTRAEALKGITINGAKASFEENLKGSIETGKLADFVVIDQDVMTCPADDIKHTKVLRTVVGGETVYQAK